MLQTSSSDSCQSTEIIHFGTEHNLGCSFLLSLFSICQLPLIMVVFFCYLGILKSRSKKLKRQFLRLRERWLMTMIQGELLKGSRSIERSRYIYLFK